MNYRNQSCQNNDNMICTNGNEKNVPTSIIIILHVNIHVMFTCMISQCHLARDFVQFENNQVLSFGNHKDSLVE